MLGFLSWIADRLSYRLLTKRIKGIKMYYRVTEIKNAVGYIFERSGKPPLQGHYAKVEEILEASRPADCLDRASSVYMCEDPEFARAGLPFKFGYVHTLEPIGKTYRFDNEWIGAIQMRYRAMPALRKDIFPNLSDQELALKYWSGEATENPSWEILARQAKVIAVTSKPIKIRGDTPFLDLLPDS